MGRVVTHSKAEMAFHPWWDDMEDYMVYGLVMVGIVLIPSAIVTGTPLDCNFCPNKDSTNNPRGSHQSSKSTEAGRRGPKGPKDSSKSPRRNQQPS